MWDVHRHPYICFESIGQNRCMSTIGQRIEQLRVMRRLSQQELADEIGIKQPSMSDIVHDKTKTISGKTLAGLCRVLHTTPDYIMFGAGSDQDDQELVLIEAEILTLLRSTTPENRESALRSVRGIAVPSAPAPHDPFPHLRKKKKVAADKSEHE